MKKLIVRFLYWFGGYTLVLEVFPTEAIFEGLNKIDIFLLRLQEKQQNKMRMFFKGMKYVIRNKTGIFRFINKVYLWGIRFGSENTKLKHLLNFIDYPTRGF